MWQLLQLRNESSRNVSELAVRMFSKSSTHSSSHRPLKAIVFSQVCLLFNYSCWVACLWSHTVSIQLCSFDLSTSTLEIASSESLEERALRTFLLRRLAMRSWRSSVLIHNALLCFFQNKGVTVSIFRFVPTSSFLTRYMIRVLSSRL